jgi:hypothetical protein
VTSDELDGFPVFLSPKSGASFEHNISRIKSKLNKIIYYEDIPERFPRLLVLNFVGGIVLSGSVCDNQSSAKSGSSFIFL